MDCDKYKNTMPYPERPCRPSLSVVISKATGAQLRQHADEVEKYEEKMVEYKKKMEAYREEDSRIYNKFREDALREAGLENHLKADKVWNMAWERGHSSGYYEVFQELEELAELLVD